MPRFISVDVELTNICGNDCAMCPREAIRRASGSMDERVFRDLLHFFGKSRCLVTFSGMGDPLLHPLLPEFIGLLREAGHETGVVVHPASLRSNFGGESGADRLVRCLPDSVTVSFPSIRRDVFERLCPSITMDEALEEVLAFSRRAGMRVRVSGILTGLNSDEGREYRDFWRRHKIPAWITPCHTRGGNLKAKELILRPVAQGSGPKNCSLFLFHTFIAWTGDILACCHDLIGETRLGSVRRGAGWSSLIREKERLAQNTPCPPFKLCRECDEPLRDINLGELPVEGDIMGRKGFLARISRESGRTK